MPSINSSQRTFKKGTTNQDYPSLELHNEPVFITVKTYPHPSTKYTETVCTAGITKTGKWIRLFPIDYRYMDYGKWYRKNQWITLDITKNTSDFRIDSFRPKVETIKKISQPLDSKTDPKWLQRKEIILSTVKYQSLEEIKDNYAKNSISLAIFKPKKILDLMIEADTSEWNSFYQQNMNQLRMFDKQPKPLTKIPFKFSYVFQCNDSRCTKPHKLSIFDWEIFMLYLNISQHYPYSMDEILEKIKQKWLHQMWEKTRDSYLIVGTRYPSPTFIVLGVFWRPK